MERKQTVLIAVCGLVVAAFLGFATFKTLQNRPGPNAVEDAQAEEETPPPRRHGPKVKKKVNLAQTFTSELGGGDQTWGGDADGNNGGQGGDQPQEPQKEFHKQTPDEAVETMWQGLDTYREMSEQDKAQTRMMMGFVTGLINMMGNTAESWMGNMSPDERAEAITNAANMIDNITAIEAEVVPDMTEEELDMILPTLDSIKSLGVTMLDMN